MIGNRPSTENDPSADHLSQRGLSHRLRRATVAIITVITVAALIGLTAAPGAAATVSTTQPSFTVDLNDDGSARVTVVFTYDLSNPDERAAFQDLAADEEAQATATIRFQSRLESIARDAGRATGRKMRVDNTAIDVTTTSRNTTGVVSLAATVAGLAAMDGDRLIVSKPFASGFTPDRRFIVQVPSGYVVASTTPVPSQTTRTTVTYTADASLEGFRLVAAPADGSTDSAARTDASASSGTSAPGQPGFGVGPALVGIVGLVIVALRSAR